MTIDALSLCNCCDVDPAAADSRAGYCRRCEAAARAGTACWHDEDGGAA